MLQECPYSMMMKMKTKLLIPCINYPMLCMQNNIKKTMKATKMTKIQAKMAKLMVTVREMITRTQTKLEVNPNHY